MSGCPGLLLILQLLSLDVDGDLEEENIIFLLLLFISYSLQAVAEKNVFARKECNKSQRPEGCDSKKFC